MSTDYTGFPGEDEPGEFRSYAYAGMGAREFLGSAAALSVLERSEQHFVVNPTESDETKLHVTFYPCECANRWFDIPTAAVERVLPLGFTTCCGPVRPHVVLTLKSEFEPLSFTCLEMRTKALLDAACFDDNRLRQDLVIHVGWQWDNHPTSCREALGFAHDERRRALDNLKQGQCHNPYVQQLYEVAHARLTDFWDVVATTNYGQPNFEEARYPHLNWQYENNLGSLSAAEREWRRGRKYSALYELLTGQRHNTGVMHLYRACYAADAARLFGIIRLILGG
jgi:hypothetical protein